MDEKDEIIARLAINVRYFRTQRGWSQAELAARVGVDTRQIGRIEQQANVPSIVLSYHIAKAFGVTLNDLLTPGK